MTPSSRRDMLPGTLDMLVLSTLTVQSMHGYGIAQHIRRLSLDMLKVEEGSLYPALQRMRQKGWIKSEWGMTVNNQRARYYSITPRGRRELGAQESGFAEQLAATPPHRTPLMREWLARSRVWFRRDRLDRELQEELRVHRERLERAATRSGADLPPAQGVGSK